MSPAGPNLNKNIEVRLNKLLDEGRAMHAYMFVGGARSRLEIGREFAKSVLCTNPREGNSCGICLSCRKFDSGNHEDFTFLNLENPFEDTKTRIGVKAIAHIQERLKFKPRGEKKLVIIDDAHLMTPEAQNKLLKTLEEPLGDSMIILLSENEEAVFRTILSRCIIIRLQPELPEISADLAAMAREFIKLCNNDAPFYERMVCLKPILDRKGDQREDATSFAQALQILLRDALVLRHGDGAIDLLSGALAGEGAHEYIKDPEKGIRAVCDAAKSLKLGYNVKYTLKKLCLEM